MVKFNELPEEVKEEVREHLKAFRECYVVYEYGRYDVSNGIGIYASYAADHKFIGSYKDDEVFTEEERIINYVESFHEYPFEYKGKRDYKLFNAIKGKWDTKFKLVDGNIEIA